MGWTVEEMEAMTAYHARMEAAFKLVEPADHWKGPIDAVVPPSEGGRLPEILESIEFFTATKGAIEPLSSGGWRVTAPGYWNGPAN